MKIRNPFPDRGGIAAPVLTAHGHRPFVCFAVLLSSVFAVPSPSSVLSTPLMAQSDTATGADASSVKADAAESPAEAEEPRARSNAAASIDAPSSRDDGDDAERTTPSTDDGEKDAPGDPGDPGARGLDPSIPRVDVADLDELAGELAIVLVELRIAPERGRLRAANRAEALASRAIEWADESESALERRNAFRLAIRAYDALAARSRADRAIRDEVFYVSKLEAMALRLKDVDVAAARVLGDFWLMQSQLYGINRSTESLATRQRWVAQRLERFLLAHTSDGGQGDPGGEPKRGASGTDPSSGASVRERLLHQVRSALLDLYDQLGEAARIRSLLAASTAVQKSGEVPGDDQAAVNAVGATGNSAESPRDNRFAYLDILGRTFDADLMLVDGETWSARNHRGRVLVIAFVAGIQSADVVIRQLDTHLGKLDARQITKLVVRYPTRPSSGDSRAVGVPEITPARSTTVSGVEIENARHVIKDWPTYIHAPGQPDLAAALAVKSLPRIVLIDAKGRVAVSGGLPAIDHVADLLPDASPR